ncbi:hypothetical protein ABPG74_012900 [Tetrahymena malaccensis]
MCLLDARCRCENGQCSHIGNQMPFNQLFNPQFLNQDAFQVLDQTKKLLNQKTEIINPIVKKVKRENDFIQQAEQNENVNNMNNMVPENVDNSNFQFQQNLLPLLNQFQTIKPVNYGIANPTAANQAQQNNNSIQNSSFLIKPSPFQASNNGLPTVSNSLETLLKDMQARVMGMFAFQSKMLTELQEKSNLQAQTINLLFDEVKQLKNIVQTQKTDQPAEVTCQPIYTQIAASNDTCSLGGPISPQGLIQYLFKKKESDYKYKLILNNPLEQPLYRERNFNINVSLVDRDDNAVSNNNRIPLNISIYTSENPPKFIDTNTSGNKILKGFTEKDLQSGQITFDKIQIKEVTSHFRNGWVFIVIFPKQLNYESGKSIHRKDDIDINEIRPLIIEKVVVKAKKLKEGKKSKDGNNSNDDSKEQSNEKIEDN